MPSPLAIADETPEAEELRRKRDELEMLGRDLGEAELALETLRAELRAFDERYLNLLGPRWSVLHGIEATLAEMDASRHPADRFARNRAAAARDQAKATEDSVAGLADGTSGPEPFAPSAELKQVYREAARAIHPDLAGDDAERAERTRVMAVVNSAYEAGDVQGIREILQNWRLRPESVVGEGVGADLVRIIRQIARVRARLSGIQDDAQALKQTDLFRLMHDVAEAATRGVDLLGVMRKKLDAEIAAKSDQLRRLREELGEH